MSAHNLYQVEEICDRVIILKRGKLLANGSMDELRGMFGSIRYVVHFTLSDLNALPAGIVFNQAGSAFTSEAHDVEALTRITEAVTSSGGRVERIESRYPSLEEMLIRIGR